MRGGHRARRQMSGATVPAAGKERCADREAPGGAERELRCCQDIEGEWHGLEEGEERVESRKGTDDERESREPGVERPKGWPDAQQPERTPATVKTKSKRFFDRWWL